MRARTGGQDDATGAPPPALPELPISPHANLVTASGLAQLQARREDALLRLDALEPADTLGRDSLARHLRWLEARIESAVPVGPRMEGRDRAGFGAWVELRHADGRQERLRIVGEDEADPLHGLLSWVSPLAQALEGARVGQRVRWRRADEELEIAVLGVAFEDEPGARH
jgi:transcription elongation GreA/GreB family factor